MPEDKNKSNTAADEHGPVEGQTVDQNADDNNSAEHLVSAIQAQLKVAEERYSNVLVNIKNRLGTLGDNVDDIRNRIPEDLGGKLEGLETSLENLNHRVAQIWAPDDAHQESVAQEAVEPVDDSEAMAEGEDHSAVAAFKEDTLSKQDTHGADRAQSEGDAGTAFDEPRLEQQPILNAPAALRSASLVEDSVSAGNEEANTRHTHGVDTFDMVETSVPGDPGSPWDQESAEALTKLYDAPVQDNFQEEVQVMPARTPDPEMDVSETGQAATSDSYETATHDDPIDAIDRDWLDNKFTEIAERIEQTLSELDPQKTAAKIDERMQSMEDRVGTALQDVATRSDVEGLRDLESHVSGMAAELAKTDTQMQRLDSIESSLHKVVAHFTEGNAAAQFADMDGMGGAGIDPNQVAEAAAAHIADHLAATGQQSDGSAIADVRNLIEGFHSEHREGNEQTSLMLDTIQQAMVQILDRLDVLEGAGGMVPAPAVAPEPAQHHDFATDEVAAAAEGWVESGVGHGSDDDITLTDPTSLQQMAEQEASIEIHPREPALAEVAQPETSQAGDDMLAGSAVAASAVAASAGAQQPLAGRNSPQEAHVASVLPSPDLLSERTDAVVMPAETAATSRDAIDKIRHNFIADAQQAKARAAQAAVRSAVEPPKKTGRANVLAGIKTSNNGGEAAGGFFGTKTRRLLVSALLAVIAIQGAIILMPSSEKSGEEVKMDVAPPAVVTQPSDLEQKTQALQMPKKSSYLSPGDGFSPAVSSDVLVNDSEFAVEDAQHRAAGSADLPFGLMLQQTTAKEWTQPGRPLYDQMPSVVTPIALKTDEAVGGPRVYKAPGQVTSGLRAKLPPLSVGPTSLRMAAAKGDPSAQFEVATRLSEGKGTNQDFKQAATWFKRSAAQGFAQAQYRLGTLYERGLGVSPDVNRAQMWYLRAAEQGNIRAMHNLAVLSAGQASGKPDYDRAAQWFIKAAEYGLADSQYNAGVLFENGLGVSKDLIKAYKWYTLAARNGDEESSKRSQKLRAKLAIEALSEAETAVRSFSSGRVDPLVNNARLAGQDWKTRQNS